MIVIAFNNFGFDHLPEARPYVEKGIEGLAQAAHDLGFHAFQLNLRPPQDTAFFERVDVPRLRRKLEELDVEISAHHHAFMPKPVLPHFIQRGSWYAQFMAYSKAALRFIHDLGGRLVTLHPPQTDDLHKEEDAFTDQECRQARQTFDEAVRELGALADTLDMRLGIEAICFPPPFPRATVFRDAQELDAFLRAPGMPHSVGLQPDVTHFHHKGMDFNQVLRQWSDRIWDVHTSDAVVHRWVDRSTYSRQLLGEVHRPVGRGSFDFAAMFRTLRAIGYTGTLTLELYPQHVKSFDDIVDTRRRLEALRDTP